MFYSYQKLLYLMRENEVLKFKHYTQNTFELDLYKRTLHAVETSVRVGRIFISLFYIL